MMYTTLYIHVCSLQINCKIWQNTPNSLIDFESDENVSLSTTIRKKGVLYKKGSLLNFVPCENDIHKQKTCTVNDKDNNNNDAQHGTFICKIIPQRDIFEIELNDAKNEQAYDIDDIPWIISRYVFNETADKGYRIHEGDLLKLGKFILKIRQIRLQRETLLGTMIDKERNTKYEDEDLSRNAINPKDIDCIKESILKGNILVLNQQKSIKEYIGNNQMLSGVNSSNKVSNEKEMIHDNNSNAINNNNNAVNCSNNTNNNKNTMLHEKPTCRICLGDEHDDINPLINPCKCSGTMKYLHLDCLKQLINSKVQKKVTERVTVLTFKTLECDICKSLFPENVKIKNTIYTIIDLNRPQTNYIIIEGIVKESPDTKSIFVISFKEDKPIKVGRASDADLRLSDISVSRAHAQLTLFNNHLVLIDTKSKFGTLVNAGNNLCVLPNKPLAVQKGNIFLKFNLKLTFCALLSCYRPRHLPYANYNSFFDTTVNNKCQIKDVPNFLWTDTQIVSEFEGYDVVQKKGGDDVNSVNVVNSNKQQVNAQKRRELGESERVGGGNNVGNSGNGSNNNNVNMNRVSTVNNHNDNTMDININNNNMSGAWDSRNVTGEIAYVVGGDNNNQGDFRW